MSGSIRVPEIGAALFRSPTSSSNSEANTEDGTTLSASPSSSFSSSSSSSRRWCEGPAATSSVVADASFRCCR
uniref:Uncharacterized protein n=1 Tax=Dicentrarchus labrax TaxID=13489 RepID=A0A8C4NQU2_DICLA